MLGFVKYIIPYKYTDITHAGIRAKYRLSATVTNNTLKGVDKIFRQEKIISSDGYIALFKEDHYRSRGNRVLEHIVVAENKLGRNLEANENVHHINFTKADNTPDNLVVLDTSTHGKAHSSIMAATTELINLGVITFSTKTNKYSTSKKWLNWYESEGQHRSTTKIPIFYLKTKNRNQCHYS